MPEPDKPKASADDEEATASADVSEQKPEVFAISTTIGPVPTIYVAQSPSEPSAASLFWHTETHVVRQARNWAACHLPHHDPDRQAHESPASDAPGHRADGEPAGRNDARDTCRPEI